MPTHKTSTPDERAQALGVFLRAHREHVTPLDVGLPSGGRRRTPGLRREEVAALASVGVAWYTWLEQGRVSASRQVLESIARTLRLGDGSLEYMLSLGGFRPAREQRTAPDADEGSLQFMVDDWKHGPALMLDDRFDLLAWNDTFITVWGDPALLRREDRNLMIMLAASEQTGDRLGDARADVVRAHLGQFRSQTAARGSDERVSAIYRILDERAPGFEDWWSCQTMEPLRDVDVPVGLSTGTVTLRQIRLHGGASSAAVLLQRPVASMDALRLQKYLAANRQPMTSGHSINTHLAATS